MQCFRNCTLSSCFLDQLQCLSPCVHEPDPENVPLVPFGGTISTVHFWKANILGFMKNPGGPVKAVPYWGKMGCHGSQVSNFVKCTRWYKMPYLSNGWRYGTTRWIQKVAPAHCNFCWYFSNACSFCMKFYTRLSSLPLRTMGWLGAPENGPGKSVESSATQLYSARFRTMVHMHGPRLERYWRDGWPHVAFF